MDGTTATCPRCGFGQRMGITFTNVTFEGNAMNVAVDCPRCGATFDATGGGDGTFSTVGGRLMRVWRGMQVAADISRWDRDRVLELRDELTRLLEGDEVDESSVPGPVARYKPKDPAELQGYLKLVLALLSILLAYSASRPAPATDAELQRLVEEAIETAEALPTVGPGEELPREEDDEDRQEEVPGQQSSEQHGGVHND
jgi:hypothetical protein